MVRKDSLLPRAIFIAIFVMFVFFAVQVGFTFFSNHVEGFCTCHGIGDRVCPNLKLLHKLYDEGVLTESTINQCGGPGWTETPYDKFSQEEGC